MSILILLRGEGAGDEGKSCVIGGKIEKPTSRVVEFDSFGSRYCFVLGAGRRLLPRSEGGGSLSRHMRWMGAHKAVVM